MNKDEVSGWEREREKAAAWYWNSNKVEATNHTAGKSIAQSVRDIWTKLPIPPTISDRILIIFRIFFAAHMRSLLCWGCWHVPVSWCDYIVIGEYLLQLLTVIGQNEISTAKMNFFLSSDAGWDHPQIHEKSLHEVIDERRELSWWWINGFRTKAERIQIKISSDSFAIKPDTTEPMEIVKQSGTTTEKYSLSAT